jgi:hypothetical protein
MPQDDTGGSRFRAFWSSLPGVLTGIAAVITAVVTLAALFRGGDDSDSDVTGGAAEAAATVPGPAGDSCFSEYFEGIPGYRLGTVEAGAYDDVLQVDRTESGADRDHLYRLRATDRRDPVRLLPGEHLLQDRVDRRCELQPDRLRQPARGRRPVLAGRERRDVQARRPLLRRQRQRRRQHRQVQLQTRRAVDPVELNPEWSSSRGPSGTR